MKFLLLLVSLFLIKGSGIAQTKQDTIDIKKATFDYIESQHTPSASQMERALHPRLVKRTFWKDKETGKEYMRETSAESMILLAESYNRKKDKFPANPKKDVKLLDISDRTASVKLTADEWIDYMHLIKVNGSWKIANVLWQYNDSGKHQ